jgi:hypothetical protein
MMANALPPATPQSPQWEKPEDLALFRPSIKLKVSIYVTQEVEDVEMKAAMLDLYLGAGVDVYNPHANVQVQRGRPSYSTILPNLIDRKRNIFLSKDTFLNPSM